MPQITLTAARQALAAYLAAKVVMADGVTPLRTLVSRLGQVNPPCALVLPSTGTFGVYQVSMDGQVDWTLRIIVVASAADDSTGQDILDPYLSVTGPSSIWAAVRADPTLGGTITGYAVVTEATGYGVMNLNGVDYLTAHLITEIGF